MEGFVIIKEEIKKLERLVREGEQCSCPVVITVENQTVLAVFTYFLTKSTPLTVYGFGQLIFTNGNRLWAQKKACLSKRMI